MFRQQKKIATLTPSFSLFNYFSVLSNLPFLFFGVPTLLQLRVLNLSLFWENMPNCPADDNLLYPCSVPFPLSSLTLEHSSFIWFLKNLSHESSLPLPRDLEWRLVSREHISLWGERGFVSNTVSQYFIFIRADWVTSSLCVGKDDCVCSLVLGPGSLRCLWFLQHWGIRCEAVTDRPVAKPGRKVLFLCGRESSDPGERGWDSCRLTERPQ